MELRSRRKVITDELEDDSTSTSSSVSNFRAFRAMRSIDMFPKAKEDFRRKQNLLGGAVSAFTIAVVSLLILYDFSSYVFGWNAYRTELSVDRGVSGAVPFDIDITFFSVPCHHLSLDAVDASGAPQEHLDHDLEKTPVDGKGQLVSVGSHKYYDRRHFANLLRGKSGDDDNEKNKKSRIGKHNKNDPNYCGPCFAEPIEGPTAASEAMRRHFEFSNEHGDGKTCCNSCDDVMKMYDKHKFPRPSHNAVEQCLMELSHQHPGCNVKGIIYVRKVLGAIFFAPGHGQNLGPMGGHVHSFTFEELLSFNSSHRINRFRIGDPNIKRFSAEGVSFPLEGRSFIVPQSSQGTIKYKLQIVPTAYRIAGSAGDSSFSFSSGDSNADTAATNNNNNNKNNGGKPSSSSSFMAQESSDLDEQDVSYEYQATEWHRIMMGGIFGIFGGATPGVVFNYDYFSMQLTHVFDRPPLSVFLVRACSIIGGLFVILGLVDRGSQFLVRDMIDWEKMFGPEVSAKVQKWLSYEM